MNDPFQAPRADWQLPRGVSRGSWDYVTQSAIASEYDAYHAEQGLLRVDDQLLADWLGPPHPSPAWAIDLGCGTGRTLWTLDRLGYRVLGVDLSSAMLQQVRRKAATAKRPFHVLRANIVCLEGLRDHSASVVTCLFSTLGMVRGAENRQAVLRHIARILRPGGRFLLHVHNRWNALRDPGGAAWLWRTWWQSWTDRETAIGDRVYAYRGLPNMYLHIYGPQELRHDLRTAGLRVSNVMKLNQTATGPLNHPWWCSAVRSSGWLVLATTG
jgi:ubiquinone/menaquinone biosynthesis C-methylase UbiE